MELTQNNLQALGILSLASLLGLAAYRRYRK
ncbi:GlyGly-CTERM sorting domain-containing protein [Acinetobacter pittii]